MAFLDNSGDIILDAVLTDAGRMRLAKGDGSFRVARFALGDDEIDYSLYNPNDTNGSAYYDLELLKTPILEAFTNNVASLNSRLLSIAKTDHLFLPTMKLNYITNSTASANYVKSGFVISSNDNTDTFLKTSGLKLAGTSDQYGVKGLIFSKNNTEQNSIRIDQGIEINIDVTSSDFDEELIESQYLLEVDSRLMNVVAPSAGNNSVQSGSYVNDDYVASYYFTTQQSNFVSKNDSDPTSDTNQVILGPRGTKLTFSLRPTLEINTSDYLFNKIGANIGTKFQVNSTTYTAAEVKSILTTIRVTGLTTGSSLDIPVLIIKKVTV